MSADGVQSVDPLEEYQGQRWQYAVVAIGMFGATGMEKGFILLKRPVAPAVHLSDDDWCITMNLVR